MTEMVANYHEMLYGFGLPYRLKNAKPFNLKSNLLTYSISENHIISTTRQLRNYEVATNDTTGWLMYVCANGIIDKARHVAANIMQRYFERDLKTHWLVSFDNLKTVSFAQAKLVVIDALFFDSSSYRRDKIYEVINHNCNIPGLSVLVIGQNTDPLAMANQLGMKPDLALLTK